MPGAYHIPISTQATSFPHVQQTPVKINPLKIPDTQSPAKIAQNENSPKTRIPPQSTPTHHITNHYNKRSKNKQPITNKAKEPSTRLVHLGVTPDVDVQRLYRESPIKKNGFLFTRLVDRSGENTSMSRSTFQRSSTLECGPLFGGNMKDGFEKKLEYDVQDESREEI